MFDAQLLLKGSTVYSPWFPRQSDNVLVTLEVAGIDEATIQVDLFHKASEDTGDGTAVTGGSITRTTTGRTSKEYAALKELVRYKFTVTGAAADDWVLFRMLMPVWFDTVKV